MPKVRKELPKAFPDAALMHKSLPLSISADAKMADSVGFKARSYFTLVFDIFVK